jgi:hypothetical protein
MGLMRMKRAGFVTLMNALMNALMNEPRTLI